MITLPSSGEFSKSAWFRLGMGLAMLGLAPLLWCVLCTAASSGFPWNAARLAPSFALAYGLPIYALRDSGQQLGWIYGPGFVIWNLPATLFQSPTYALFLAAVWNVLTWLVPFGLILRAAGVVNGWMVFASAAYCGVLVLGSSATNYMFSFVHVDALCVGAGLVACLALHRAATEGNARWLHLAAAGAVASFWTKQTAIMLVPAMFAWLWQEGHRRMWWPLFFWCVVYAAASTLVFFIYFGAPEILFNLWLVNVRKPWRGGPVFLAAELGRMFFATWAWLPLAVLVGWLRRTTDEPRAPFEAGALVRLLLWCAVTQLPLGIAAALKDGGGLNSLHSLHYLQLVLLIFTFHALTRRRRGKTHRWLVPGCLWLAAVAVPLGNAAVYVSDPGFRWTFSHRQELLVKLAREQPGRFYFPWNPLATLIAEHKIQPLDDALYCLWNEHLEPPVEKIREAVPRDPIILYEEPAQSHFALRYFKRTVAQPKRGTE